MPSPITANPVIWDGPGGLDNSSFVIGGPVNPDVDQGISNDLNINGSTSDVAFGDIPGDDQIVDDYSAGASLSQIMKDNPGLSYEQYINQIKHRIEDLFDQLKY